MQHSVTFETQYPPTFVGRGIAKSVLVVDSVTAATVRATGALAIRGLVAVGTVCLTAAAGIGKLTTGRRANTELAEVGESPGVLEGSVSQPA